MVMIDKCPSAAIVTLEKYGQLPSLCPIVDRDPLFKALDRVSLEGLPLPLEVLFGQNSLRAKLDAHVQFVVALIDSKFSRGRHSLASVLVE